MRMRNAEPKTQSNFLRAVGNLAAFLKAYVINNLFGYRKVSYRDVAENEARAKAQVALVNLRASAGCWTD